MSAKKEDDTKELNFKEGEKVMISPIGDVVGEDGRSFTINPDIIQNIKTHIPLDENHNYGRAVGWFDKDSLELRDDGIYASLELTDEGKTLVDAKAYRYMSPVFSMADNRVVVDIDSVGLVNVPNLLYKELNKKVNEVNTQKEQNSVTDTEFQAALAEKDKEIEALKAKIKELEDAAAANEANAKAAKVDKLVAEGALLEDQKELALEMNDKQLETFVLQNKKLIAAAGGRLNLQKNDKEANALSESEMILCKRLDITPEEYTAQKGDK